MEIINQTIDENGKKHIKVRYTEDEKTEMKKKVEKFKRPKPQSEQESK